MIYPPNSIKITPATVGWRLEIICQSYDDAKHYSKLAKEAMGELMLPCGCVADSNDPKGPIYWNPYNKVVQCHKCGQSYEKVMSVIPARFR